MKQIINNPAQIVNTAIERGAKLYASISGGKDGQAMVKNLVNWGYEITGLIHADLGRVEWPESMGMCERLQAEIKAPLYISRRSDGLDMLAYWERRMNLLKGSGKPFWSSAQNRYCTSDLKRVPINKFFTTCEDFIISCEGVRAQESVARAKKQPLEIRWSKTSTYYKGMTVEQAIEAFISGKRLILTWYPIFNFTAAEVWATYGVDDIWLEIARDDYKSTDIVPEWWPFHPAYVYGNERVSCMFCVLGSINDLKVASCKAPALLNAMIALENEGSATFKNNWSLKNLLPLTAPATDTAKQC